jgi:hypothetical protein
VSLLTAPPLAPIVQYLVQQTAQPTSINRSSTIFINFSGCPLRIKFVN